VREKRAIIAARDAAPLADFRAALLLGRLVICGNCAHFAFGAEAGGVGHCRRFGCEAWPFAPFVCSGFTMSPTPTAEAYLPDRDGAKAIAGQTGTKPVYSRRRVS
jgi:hypothetical protein